MKDIHQLKAVQLKEHLELMIHEVIEKLSVHSGEIENLIESINLTESLGNCSEYQIGLIQSSLVMTQSLIQQSEADKYI